MPEKPLHQRTTFEARGVRCTRQTALHEPGRYQAVVQRTGRTYEITRDGGTVRYPWIVQRQADRQVWSAENIRFAVALIADVDRHAPVSR